MSSVCCNWAFCSDDVIFENNWLSAIVTCWLPHIHPLTNKQTKEQTNKQTKRKTNKQRNDPLAASTVTLLSFLLRLWAEFQRKKQCKTTKQTNRRRDKQTNERTKTNPQAPIQSSTSFYIRETCVSYHQRKPHDPLWPVWPSHSPLAPDWASNFLVVSPWKTLPASWMFYILGLTLYQGKEIHCWLQSSFSSVNIEAKLPVVDLQALCWYISDLCETCLVWAGSSEKHREGCLQKLGKVRKVDLVNVVAAVPDTASGMRWMHGAAFDNRRLEQTANSLLQMQAGKDSVKDLKTNRSAEGYNIKVQDQIESWWCGQLCKSPKGE